MNAFLYLTIVVHCCSPSVLTSFQMQLISEMEVRTMTDKEDKTVWQFVLFCRTALRYEKRTITMNGNIRQSVERRRGYSIHECPFSYARYPYHY